MSPESTRETTLNTLVPAICASAEQAFETMVFMPLTRGEVTEKLPGSPSGSISGTIGITGPGICGSISLLFSTTVAEALFRSMMMMEPDDAIDPKELRDAVGELANMVAGGAKAALQGRGTDFVISLPTVVIGEAHCLESPGDVMARVVTMGSDKGEFHMVISVS